MATITFDEGMFANKFVSLDKKPEIIVTECSLPLTPPPEETNDSPFWTTQETVQLEEAQTLSPSEPESIVAVIGVGYVGTHLVEAFAGHYNVIAFDLSNKRLEEVSKQLTGLPIQFTSNAADISEATHVLISVPTILTDDKKVDTTYLRSAIATVEKYVKPGSTIVVESSVAVGMTRALVGPLMASKNFKVGMSPERVDPGRTFPAFEDISKIVSGLDAASLESISTLYGRVFHKLLPVSSPEVAEMTKLYENCQRMVCATYANEMADACNSIGIDAFEVSNAAASKPFGYLPFRPGPGIGGHCIPVNPYYLLSNLHMPLLEHAATISSSRPRDVARSFVQSVLQGGDFGVDTSQLRLLVVGVGFKRGQSVMSNSPGAAIIQTLKSEYNCHVEFADPLVTTALYSAVPKLDTEANWNAEYLSTYHGIIVSVDQEGLDMNVLANLSSVRVQDFSGTLKNSASSVPSLAAGKEIC
ncbi:nucleotide sugar dehydrogenase [Stemphylium lycopersici]|uniref:Nucleotide sugar dehydrogenase n=1 Tax=Stemphylium lycopersici TaxID=183478 RepID=A0A364MU27_STELY|nr:nucleotide sugar dehydrogenase [Stemphylium lycopersici]RAR03518.1 nucleotide sugar dehydrogenase [Stemphylium lycopersici]